MELFPILAGNVENDLSVGLRVSLDLGGVDVSDFPWLHYLFGPLYALHQPEQLRRLVHTHHVKKEVQERLPILLNEIRESYRESQLLGATITFISPDSTMG